MGLKIGLIFLSTNSLTLYIKYNKLLLKITKKGVFLLKKCSFFTLISCYSHKSLPRFHPNYSESLLADY